MQDKLTKERKDLALYRKKITKEEEWFWYFAKFLVKHLYDAMDSEDDPIANY